MSVLVGTFRRVAKVMALGSVILGVVLALYTGSRGGMVGLVLFFALFLLVRIQRVSKKAKAGMILVLLLAGMWNANKINVDRYLSIGELDTDYNNSEFGRVGIWTRGLQLFREHPFMGVGAGRFGEGVGTLRKEDNLVPRWQAPHNAYIQVLAELGIFAAAAFLLLILSSGWSLLRLMRKGRDVLPEDIHTFAAILFAGLAAELVTAFFLSQAYSILFTLSFAVAASLRSIAQATRVIAPQPAGSSHLGGWCWRACANF